MQTINKDSHLLAVIAEKIGISFNFHGQELTHEEVFAPDGGLPLFYLAAREIAEDLGIKHLGVGFTPDKGTLFGLEATFTGDEIINSTRLMFCFEALLQCERSMKQENKQRYEISELVVRLEAPLTKEMNTVKMENV